jgi:hypothetical protein
MSGAIGIIELVLVFGAVLALAVIDLSRTKIESNSQAGQAPKRLPEKRQKGAGRSQAKPAKSPKRK